MMTFETKFLLLNSGSNLELWAILIIMGLFSFLAFKLLSRALF